MKSPARPLRFYLPMLAVLAMGMGWNATAGAATSQLDWQNKDDNQAAYPVPPSPYGQIGDPFVHTLRWPAKTADPQPAAQPTKLAPPRVATPVRAAPMASIAAPVPVAPPQPVAVSAPPSHAPAKADNHPDPGLADDPGMAADAPIIGGPSSPPVAVSAPPAPPAAPAAATVAAHTAHQTAQTDKDLQSGLFDGGFQVPASSPYAARIAAARAAAARQSAPPAAAPTPAAPTAALKTDPAPTQAATQTPAPASAPTTTLATAADRPFVPGEHYTDPSQEPRFYSLHREYGYRPDPITVDDHPTGALLTLTPDKTSHAADGSSDDAASPSSDQKDATPATKP